MFMRSFLHHLEVPGTLSSSAVLKHPPVQQQADVLCVCVDGVALENMCWAAVYSFFVLFCFSFFKVL